MIETRTIFTPARVMRIHSMVARSTVNGPGVRSVLWFQGCVGLNCPGCWNEPTHDPDAGREMTIDEIITALPHDVDGLTCSGGEPIQQAPALLSLIETIRQRFPKLSIGMFSGYSEGELNQGRYHCEPQVYREVKLELWRKIRLGLDFAILGRYNRSQPAPDPLVTSRNQKLVLLTSRYSLSDFGPQAIEITIDRTGLHTLTGFPVLGSL